MDVKQKILKLLLQLKSYPVVRMFLRFKVRVVYLMRSFFAAVREDGVLSSVVRMYNYMVHGKGVMDGGKYAEEQEKIKKATYSLDKHLGKLSGSKTRHNLDQKIDVIVPVYNGFEYLELLFESIVKNTSAPYRLIIAEDKSSDERVRLFLENFVDNHDDLEIEYIQNEENLGFVKNVNNAVAKTKHHFVILNTDTEVAKGWLEKLMRPILVDEKIASTTPYTNAGEIFSFPRVAYVGAQQEMIEGVTLEDINEVLEHVVDDTYTWEVPTGMGYCMGVNKDIVDEIGFFDVEAFGKGYGEETDWCRRAKNAGYKNVHVPQLFIYHKHGGSFSSEEKQVLLENNLQVLNKRYPEYHREVKKYFETDEHDAFRMFLYALVLLKKTEKNTCIFDHALGGGANMFRERYTKKRAENDEGVVTVAYDTRRQNYKLEIAVRDEQLSFAVSETHHVRQLLQYVDCATIIINELVSYPDALEMLTFLQAMKKEKDAEMIFYLHDYFAISPNFTLVGASGVYEGVEKLPEDLESALHNLAHTKTGYELYCDERNILLWREKWGAFLHDTVDKIIAFDEAPKKILCETYENLNESKVQVVPHDVSYTKKLAEISHELREESSEQKKVKVIGVLGSINFTKGSEIVADLAQIIDRENLSYKIVIIGEASGIKRQSHITVHGKFNLGDLPRIISDYGVDVFVIPSVWPETFSYTTSEIIAMQYPLLVFDLGAPATRVREYEKGTVVPEISADAVMNALQKVM